MAELVAERIRRRSIVDENGCWLWQGAIDKRWGYGKLKIGSRRDGTRREVKAHRASYEAFVGLVPEGLTLDHSCNVRRCVNPEHLTPMTMKENTLKPDSRSPSAINARRVLCINGHELEVRPGKTRICRVCARERAAAWRAERRGDVY